MKLRTRLSALAAAALVCAAGLTASLPQSADAAISSEGTEFWLAFNSNQGSAWLTLYVAGAPGVTGTVEVPGQSLTYPFTIPPSQVAEVALSLSVMMDPTRFHSTEPRAIHVTASADVTVYGLNQETSTADAYLGLPVTAVGQRYRILDYQGSGYQGWGYQGAFIGVVPTAPGTTTFTITPPAALGRPAITRTVDQGHVFQYKIDSEESWTGTLVESDKPVSVFGGAQCASVPRSNVGACDHLVEQMMPTSTWGKTFVTFPLSTSMRGDRFRIVADEDATKVQVQLLNTPPVTETLDAGEYYEFTTSEPTEIVADKPISVAQYYSDYSTSNHPADPFMVLVSPQEQGFTTSIFVSPLATTFTKHFVNIKVPTADTAGVTLDGTAVTGWTPIAASAFSAVTVEVTPGAHEVVAPTLAQTIVYGFGSSASYGYPGGGKIAKIATISQVTVDPDRTGRPGDKLCTTVTVKDSDDKPVESVNVDVAVT
ncbi:MAG: IgGFc-binding protein, partial [Propionibacteriaceae bacterium]|nr:IgGFc-binding protein [Propionibacteriaceae bacterium]